MKRFYKTVSTREAPSGYEVLLDSRVIKTPAKKALVAPTQRLALAIADEWEAQSEVIQPDTMPMMQFVSTAFDRVAENFDLVTDEIAAFGGTDLLCYRADEPVELIEREEACWGPYLVWAKDTLGAKLSITSGIMPISQEAETLERLKAEVKNFSVFEVTALHEFTNGLGSLILALAFMKGHSSLEKVMEASLLDHNFQEEQWGEDWEVTEKREKLRANLKNAAEFLCLLKGEG